MPISNKSEVARAMTRNVIAGGIYACMNKGGYAKDLALDDISLKQYFWDVATQETPNSKPCCLLNTKDHLHVAITEGLIKSKLYQKGLQQVLNVLVSLSVVGLLGAPTLYLHSLAILS